MKNHEQKINSQSPFTDAVEKVLLSLRGIRYGSVEVIIHDSKVVQIERKEKLRLDTPTPVTQP